MSDFNCSTLSFFTQVYRWVRVLCGGNISIMDYHPIPGERGGGGGSNTSPSCYMLRKPGYAPCGPLRFEVGINLVYFVAFY